MGSSATPYIVPLPGEAAVEYALGLAEQVSRIHQDDEIPSSFPEPLRELIEDWHFETESKNPGEMGLWLHSMHGGIDAVCGFIQHLLQRYSPDQSVTLEWSNDCSKPRTDAFGGGAAIVTARRIKSMTTGEWLEKNTPKAKSQ